MRNRGVEIYLDVPDVKNIHPCDLDSLLSKRGIKSSLHKDIIFDIHQKVVYQEIGKIIYLILFICFKSFIKSLTNI